jgi:TniQ
VISARERGDGGGECFPVDLLRGQARQTLERQPANRPAPGTAIVTDKGLSGRETEDLLAGDDLGLALIRPARKDERQPRPFPNWLRQRVEAVIWTLKSQLGLERHGGRQDTGKPWLHRLDEPDLAALSAATGVPAGTLAGMTLARYQGTGLSEVTAPPGMARTPRWWRQLSCSRYCPRCLAANGGRWMLAWRIPWAFACTGCQVVLADTCPDCGRRHRRTRTGQPRQPGRCDLTGLPLPPPRPPGATTFSCASDLAGTPAVALLAGGHVLAAQQHTDAIISALLASRGRPAEAAALRQQLDDIYAVARAAASAVNGQAALPPAAAAVLGELASPPGAPGPQGPGAGTLPGPVDRYRRQLAPVAAFGAAVADIMLHGRPDDPDPEIAAWLAANGAVRRSQPGPGDMLAEWNRPAPPSKPHWPGHSQPAWTPSASSATAPSPTPPASPAPARPATWPPSSRH